MQQQASVIRVYFYVDGFNFYHATRDTPFYPYGWCDWKAVAASLCRPPRELLQVKYFTSWIECSKDSAKKDRQRLHIKGMEKMGARVFYGKFVLRTSVCPNCNYEERKYREKKTDTNIAVQMVLDAAHNRYDQAYLVTADADLLPPVEAVTSPLWFRPPKKVTVLLPPGQKCPELECFTNQNYDCFELREHHLKRLPEEWAVELGFREFPERWKLRSKR